MGSIRRLDNNADPQAFPGANFVAVGDIPLAQCSEAKIEGDAATTETGPPDLLIDPGAFTGFDLTGKVAHITASVGGTPGDYDISSNDNDVCALTSDPGNGDPVTYYISDGGALILTRDVQSLAKFIHAAGYAYTFKGGKLYTDMPNGLLKEACTILWDPLT